jgi:hypothetical protein
LLEPKLYNSSICSSLSLIHSLFTTLRSKLSPGKLKEARIPTIVARLSATHKRHNASLSSTSRNLSCWKLVIMAVTLSLLIFLINYQSVVFCFDNSIMDQRMQLHWTNVLYRSGPYAKVFLFHFHSSTMLYKTIKITIYLTPLEELDGRAVSALGVRSRKLSTGLNGQS